jgi:hypothetical protein
MSDEPFYTPNRPPAPPRTPKPGELLFEFLHGHDRILCELRDDGETYLAGAASAASTGGWYRYAPQVLRVTE